MPYDIVIKNGCVFDGESPAGRFASVGIRDGQVVALSDVPLDEEGCPRVIDARGCWVTPGFLEMHSHYDAEILASPALKESVRHGVTTVATGLCSISMVSANAQDCADMFSRVESIPHEYVISLLKERKTWTTPAEYRRYIENQPVGPNVCCYLGHSDIRTSAMGLEDATSHRPPSQYELDQMVTTLEEALDNGFLGLSVMATKIDRVGGDRAWARPLPSTFASWREYRLLFASLRKRRAILQGAPDVAAKTSAVEFMLTSAGWFRPKLKTTLLTALDLKVTPLLHVLTRVSGWVTNHLFNGNLRWQFLPAPLRVYSDGLDFNNFDEFTGGTILRNMKSKAEQYEKIKDVEFRKEFKAGIESVLKIGLWHRDFSDAWVVKCPDRSLVGKNFAEIGKERGENPIDSFLNLIIEFKDEMRWTTLMGNNRTPVMHNLIRSRQTHIGFADSGAHIRGLAFYNFPLRLLKYVRDAELAGKPFMKVGAAVSRLTGELADWYGIDAGHLLVGRRADIAIVDPQGLDEGLDEVHEDLIENTSLTRLVNRNDRAVVSTIINGKVAYDREAGFTSSLGVDQGFGRFLAARRGSRQ